MRAMKRIAMLIALFLLWSSTSLRAESKAKMPVADRGTFAITDVLLFDGTQFVPHATVVVDHGTITRAGAKAKVPKGVATIDGKGKTLLPGLIDAHTHVWGNALQRALRFGVTTELDMFTSAGLAREMRAQQAAGPVYDRADLRSAGTLVTVAGGHGTEYGSIPTFTPHSNAQAYVNNLVAEGSDYIKIVIEDGSHFGSAMPTLDAGDVKALVAAAHAREKLAVVHVSTLAGAREAIDAGADGLVHLFADAPDPEFGKYAAAHHVFIVPTMTVLESSLGMKGARETATDSKLAPYLDSDEVKALSGSFPTPTFPDLSMDHVKATIAQLRAAAVPILAGTDSGNPGTTHGASIHRELVLLVDSGMSPAEALAASTSQPAQLFHLSDRGRIEPGYRADLLLVSGDASQDIRATRAIDTVWKNGRRFDRAPEVVKKEEPAPAAAIPATGVISDFESGAGSSVGNQWMISTDQFLGGKSIATMNVVEGGANGSAHALSIDGEIRAGYAFPWSGVMLMLAPQPMQPVDLRPKSRLVFSAKGVEKGMVLLFSSSNGRIPANKTVTVGAEWTTVSIPLSELNSDGHDVQAIFIGGSSGAFHLLIDNVRLE